MATWPAGRWRYLLQLARQQGGEHEGGFDGFPMWNSDGSQLVFGSNRNNRTEGDTNVFIADWVE